MRAPRIFLFALILIGPALASCGGGPFVSSTPLITSDRAEANYSFIVFRFPKVLAFPDLPEDAVVLVRDGNTYDSGTFMFLSIDKDLYAGQIQLDLKDTTGNAAFRYLYFGIQLLPEQRIAHVYKLLSTESDILPGLRRCAEGLVCVDSIDAFAERIRVEMEFAPQMTLTHLTLFH